MPAAIIAKDLSLLRRATHLLLACYEAEDRCASLETGTDQEPYDFWKEEEEPS